MIRGLCLGLDCGDLPDKYFSLGTLPDEKAREWLTEGLVRWSALDSELFCKAIEWNLGITIEREVGLLPLNSGDQCMVVKVEGLPGEPEDSFTQEQIAEASFTFRLLTIK